MTPVDKFDFQVIRRERDNARAERATLRAALKRAGEALRWVQNETAKSGRLPPYKDAVAEVLDDPLVRAAME